MSHRPVFSRRGLLPYVLGCLAVFGLAIPATAVAIPTSASDVPGAGGSLFVGHSLAGYEFTAPLGYGGGGPTTATTHFVVPTLRCGSAFRAIAAGVGYSDSAAALFIGCSRGRAYYWPYLKLNGDVKKYPTKAAHAGDTIVLYLTEHTKSGLVSVTDETHKLKVSLTGGGTYVRDNAWIGDVGWRGSSGALEGVADFRALRYSKSNMCGHSLRYFNRQNRTGSAGVLKIRTGGLSSSEEGFTTYFKHS